MITEAKLHNIYVLKADLNIKNVLIVIVIANLQSREGCRLIATHLTFFPNFSDQRLSIMFYDIHSSLDKFSNHFRILYCFHHDKINWQFF